MVGQADYQYDLFVSYTSTDCSWVQRYLLPALGLPSERIITTQNFRPGALTINEFERAVTTSRYTVLVLSPDYLNDKWSSLSELLASYSSVAERRDRIIPLLLKPCELPLHIDYRVRLDCTSEANWESEIARLRALLAEPEPNFRTQTQDFLPVTIPRPLEWSVVPKTTSLPINHVPSAEEHFVGREQLIHEMVAAAGKTRLFAILGIPGIGKTALMAQIASRLEPRRVFWHEFRPGLVSLNDVLIRLARFLDSQPEREGSLVGALQAPVFSEHDRIALVIKKLNAGCYYLFFDSVHYIEKDSLTDSFFLLLKQQLQQGKTFVASRSIPCFCKRIDKIRKVVKVVELDGLRESNEIQDFFAKQGISLKPEVAETIDKHFGGLPLALELIAGLLKEDFNDENLLALATRTDDSAIEHLFEPAIEHLFEEVYERLNLAEQNFLTIASLFNLPFLRDNLVIAYQVIFAQNDGENHFTKLKRQLLIQQLVPSFYKIHEAIRTLTLKYAKGELSKYQVQLADYLVGQMQDDDWIQLEAILLYYRAEAFDKSAELVVPLVDMNLLPYKPDWAEIILKRFQEEMVSPEQWVWLVGCNGHLAKFWRRYEEAEDYYQTMLKLAEEIQDKAAAAIAFQRLGIIYSDRNAELAERNYLNSLALKKELNDLEGQAQVYNQLGTLYTNQHRLAEARLALEKGVNLLESIDAPDWQKLSLYGNLGSLYGKQGEWEDAIRFTESTRQIAEEMNMLYDLAMSIYNLGVHSTRQGNQDAAQKYYLDALEIARKYSLWQLEELVQIALGKQQHELNNYDEAIASFQRVLEIQEEIKDKDNLAVTYFDIGSLYCFNADYPTALSYYEKGIELFENLTDEEQVQRFLGNIYALAKQSTASRQILQALKILKNRLLVNSPSYVLARVYGTLGKIYLKLLHRDRVALACLQQEIQLLAQLERRHEQVEALMNLGFIYEEMGSYGQTLDTNTEAINIAEIEHLYTLAGGIYYNRANCFTEIEMWQQAEDDYRCALAIAEDINDTQLQESVRHNLGEMYRRWGRSEDAIELLNSSLEFARQHNDVDGQIITLNNLGLAYRTLSQAQEALTCFNEALELSRRHYRKRDESIVLISLGNFYLLDEQPDKAKQYYESALTVARAAEDTEWEENSILSLAYAHRQLGTFDSIAEDVKAVAERAFALKHYENSIKFLILCGKINLEDGEPELSAEMFEKALLIAYMLMHERLQQIGSRINSSSLAMELREVINDICDAIKEALERGSVGDAKAMYSSILNRLQHQGETGSWITNYCLKPIGEHLYC